MLYSLVLVALASGISASALPHRSMRVVGGEDADIENHPYQVALEYRGYHYCGGVIISAHYILTTGQCMLPPSVDTMVRAGTSYQGEGGSLHQITESHLHEEFGANEHSSVINDIAIIRVKEPFVFDKTRQPIKLFEAGEQALPGVMSVVTGFGETADGLPDQLQAISVPIVSKEVCNKAYAHWGGLPEGQICAGLYGVGGKDPCRGDDGGPLVINGRLAGLTSYGEGCAEPNFPGIYTEIAAYRDWIDKNVKLN